MLRSFGATEKCEPVTSLRAHLQAPDLVWACLREPGYDRAGRTSPDQLFCNPKPLSRRGDLDPYQMAVVEAFVQQAG